MEGFEQNKVGRWLELHHNMARHFTKHPHEFNTFRLWAWERKPPDSNTPEGLTSWKLGKAWERAGRLVWSSW